MFEQTSKVAKGTSLLLGQSLVSGFFRILNIMILTRLLFQSEIGQIALMSIIFGFTQFLGALGLNHAILGINAKILTDDLDEVRKGCITVTGMLATLKDLEVAQFKALWEEAYTDTAEGWRLGYAQFERFMAFHASRVNSKAKWLREHLNK